MTFPKNAHLRSPVIKKSTTPTILALLQKHPHTAKELAEVVDRLPSSVADKLRTLRKQGVVHISGWRKNASAYTPVWSYGHKSDAVHPRSEKVTLHSQRKQTVRERTDDAYLLSRNYVQSERIWGI